MKKGARLKPIRLAKKLRQIRSRLGLSQSEMLERIGFSEELFRSNVSQYELGRREPPLPVLLAYARAVDVIVDVLIDDELDLSAMPPSPIKHTGVKRAASARKGK
jgi:transcriptional regulator with XRE-family HTH domain